MSTTTYNNRLQPYQFRLTDASSGSSYIRENYAYWGDGRLQSVADLDDTGGTNPPATLRFLSRSYGYDQAGRVAQVYSSNQAPLRQTYGYDEFDNMTSRSGTVYWQPYQTATFAYTNNRHNGWSYYPDGQVLSSPATTTDDAFSFYYDAAGRLSRTIDTATNRMGDYRPSFDGDGRLAYEWSQTTQNGYPSPATSSYILRSTVLGGEILTRLNQNGNKSGTYVPAEGLLFATQGVDYQGSPYVGWTQRNPLGITETGKGIYDPLGNYIPFEQHNDPRPPAGSYNSSSMSGIAASMSANPFGSDTGCLMDGLPTSCSRVLRALNGGQTQGLTVSGRGLPQVDLIGWGIVLTEGPLQNDTRLWGVWVPGRQSGNEPNRQDPAKPQGPGGGRVGKNAAVKCDAKLPSDPDQLALVYSIMHENTSPSSIGKQQYGDDSTRSGPVITEDTLLTEAHYFASAIKNFAIATKQSIVDAVSYGGYMTDGKHDANYFFNLGQALTNGAIATSEGSPECKQLKRAIDAATNADPNRALLPEYQHWRGMSGGPRTRLPGELRIGDTDFRP